MLTEKRLNDALVDYVDGLVVKVLTLEEDGTGSWTNLADLLPQNAHYMVDVPDVDIVQAAKEKPAKKSAPTVRKKVGGPNKEPETKESV